MSETLHWLRSDHLGNERSIWVRPPKVGLRSDRLVVFLDGELYRERMGAVDIIEKLEAAGEIAPAFHVCVSYFSKDARWIECPCYPPFARFIDEELLPHLTALHPEMAACQERVIAGLSYSGLAAAYVALQVPARFTKVIAQSGSFWSDDGWLAKQYRVRGREVPAAFYLEVGNRETQENVEHKPDVMQVMSQVAGVRLFRDALIDAGHTPHYVEFDGGHEFAAWTRSLPEALRWALPVKRDSRSLAE